MGKQADFYLLNNAEPTAVLHFACRLIRKTQQQKISTLVWVESATQAQQFDDLLWTFSDEAFIPHRLNQQPQIDSQFPVQISPQLPDSLQFDLVVSLNQSEKCPLSSQTTARIAEVVSASEQCKQHGRQRYAHYREKGFQLAVHKIT